MSVVLETATDRSVEEYAVDRLLSLYEPGTQFHRMPPFSFCDYAVTYNGSVTEFVEIKTRKEPHFVVRGYGGLILKCRKAEEMRTLAKMSGALTTVVFAFGNGRGAYYQINALDTEHLEPVQPPRRRNYRDLACDEEPVHMLDWDADIERILDPEDFDDTPAPSAASGRSRNGTPLLQSRA